MWQWMDVLIHTRASQGKGLADGQGCAFFPCKRPLLTNCLSSKYITSCRLRAKSVILSKHKIKNILCQTCIQVCLYGYELKTIPNIIKQQ